MNRTVVTVRRETMFKDVVCALLASDAGAVPVVDDTDRPVGLVTEEALVAKLEFHGGNDPRPLLGGAKARNRWRQSAALTAGDLMTGPPTTVYGDTRIGRAAARLAHSQPLLCVVDEDMRLIGVLTARDLLSVYQRSDQSLIAEIHALLTPDVQRPARSPAPVTVQVDHGVVILDGSLTFRSRAEHAGYTVAHIPGVVAVHNNLTYDLDDLAITGF
ncbi:CBS domain-containing protein [Kribbella sp. NPDC050124]|uniref:CBS domain-containing protein n=1 Tax=Kribbella sp. NPDC050124 TaxID=3364114 RepID=UPI00378B6A1F